MKKTNSKKIVFNIIESQCKKIAWNLKKNKQKIISILINYETHYVAEDEINRTLDLLENIKENASYFQGNKIKGIAVFLPSNQPLYAFFCFAAIPSFQANKVYVRLPQNMKMFFKSLMNEIKISRYFPNINIINATRESFLNLVTATKLDKQTNYKVPVIDCVIFTGTTETATKIRKMFHKKVLFIFNGSGHNPVVISYNANIKQAVKSVIELQFYNQGQDCAAPNSILVHKKIFTSFYSLLKEEVKKVKIGKYQDKDVLIGPITRKENLNNISNILIKNYDWIDSSAEICFKQKIVKPIIINKPLKYGGNYIESYAPIMFIQMYNSDNELHLYFENSQYLKNSMYITIFGNSQYLDMKKFSYNKKYGIILNNIHLHEEGVERGINEYGGYGKGASSLSYNGITYPQPTLPQRDIYTILIQKNIKDFDKKSNIKKESAMQKSINHWSISYVDRVLERFPDKDIYVCAAGISPSGKIHFGNFRDIVTSYAVLYELKKRGKKVRFIFSWDNFDRFRKVPKGINEDFEKYIGLPLATVPSPDGKKESYATYNQDEFEKTMKELNIEIEYRYQIDEYKSGRYDKEIIHALKNRKKIADILLSFMSDKAKQNKSINDNEYRETYYPISVYSQFSGKDNTKIISYNGDKEITYKCFDSGKTATIDITKERIVKLAWKIDWAMRWKKEGVTFEPGGRDHSAPGGSYDTSSIIAKEIFNIDPPVYQGYDFVGIRGLGSKMSGSKGNSVTPSQLLEIYEPEILKWLYFKADPSKSFTLAFDSEVYRQYAEFDKKLKNNDEITAYDKRALELSNAQLNNKHSIPFRQAVSFGQISQWNKEKLLKFLEFMNMEYDTQSIDIRLKKARAWLETYNRDEIIKLLENKNIAYINTLNEKDKKNILKLKKQLQNNPNASMHELDNLVYEVIDKKGLDKKEMIKEQGNFFKIVYNLLIGKNAGPRLSIFLWAIEDKKKIMELLDV